LNDLEKDEDSGSFKKEMSNIIYIYIINGKEEVI